METKFKEFTEEVIKIITPSEEKMKQVISDIRMVVKDNVSKSNLKSLVIGISGGLDSAVVAALMRPVCDELNIPLIGVSIPLGSSVEHMDKANYIGCTYCDSFMVMNQWESSGAHELIDSVVKETDRVAKDAGFNVDSFDNNIAQGNIKARLRMLSLYRLAGVTGGAVLSTDNYSEYFLGFWTICGDVGDISPIQFVEKGTEEVVMAKVLGIREDIINQKPSDGLNTQCESGDCDEDQLGLSYKDIGPIIMGYEYRLPEALQKKFNELSSYNKIQDIIKRHERTEYKRRGPFFVTRKMNKLFNYL